MKLSRAQGDALLKLYLTGNFGGFPFKTYEKLSNLGLIDLGQKITVTNLGKTWCDENHLINRD